MKKIAISFCILIGVLFSGCNQLNPPAAESVNTTTTTHNYTNDSHPTISTTAPTAPTPPINTTAQTITNANQNEVSTSSNHDHVYSLKTILQPSCDTAGKKAYICEICQKKQYETPIDPLGHNFIHSTTLSIPPTCESDGKNVLICNRCNSTQQERIPAYNHSWQLNVSCNSQSNEIVITPICNTCQTTATETIRYKIDDVTKLISVKDDCFAELDYTIIDPSYQRQVPKAPYYRVYCTSNYLLIIRKESFITPYYNDGSQKSPKDFFESYGCSVVYEVNLVLDKDGLLSVER